MQRLGCKKEDVPILTHPLVFSVGLDSAQRYVAGSESDGEGVVVGFAGVGLGGGVFLALL